MHDSNTHQTIKYMRRQRTVYFWGAQCAPFDPSLQAFLAMGFFALTIMRRWRKWARREAGMRGLFVKLSIRDAVRRWKQVARLDAFQATLQRLVMRGALRRWTRELQMRAALAMAVVHYSRRLVSKVGTQLFS